MGDLGDCAELIARGLIAPSPGEAVRRVARQFEGVPNRLGTNCSGLSVLRALVKGVADPSGQNEHALLFVAAHTHWEPLSPILYTFDKAGDRFRVGPQHGIRPFQAVGFVFTPSGVVPYEWADASCSIDAHELVQAWRLIERLNAAVVAAPFYFEGFPFGVSINFRFKTCFAPAETSTHEVPGDSPDVLSYIYKASAMHDLTIEHGDQVGWSAATPPHISAAEEMLLAELEGIFMNKMPSLQI